MCHGRVDKITGLNQALVFLISRVWVRVPVLALVSLSKAHNRNSFVLRMEHQAIGSMCCVMHANEPCSLIVYRRALPPCFWQLLLSVLKHLVNHYKVLHK